MNFARVLGLVQSAVCSRDASADETFDLWGSFSRCETPRVYQFWFVVYNRRSQIYVKRTNRLTNTGHIFSILAESTAHGENAIHTLYMDTSLCLERTRENEVERTGKHSKM